MTYVRRFRAGVFFMLLFLIPTVVRAAVGEPRALTQDLAEARRHFMADVAYDLNIQLAKNQQNYDGTVTIQFNLQEVPPHLFLDFAGGEVKSYQVNGVDQSPQLYDGYVLDIPAGVLKVGSNTLTVGFSHPYLTTGHGLYRFVDPDDKEVYLYSQFETNFAQTMFPNFDQPDLKAAFQLSVTAPPTWEVISTMRESQVSAVDGGRKWVFPKTQPISPYVFSLHAGPYHKWEAAQAPYPMRLFARKSQARYVDAENWFDVTRRGFAFYESYFGVPYPFQKYDQIIVPVIGFSAMENIAAVTFGDKFVYREKPTRHRLQVRAEVILHEMAHMWFGNLVTMKWWDDLWLNESFATYMSALALDAVPEFRGENWIEFSRMKIESLEEDSLGNTHAISLPVPDTEHATVNFDGITYGKGAAFLRQLDYYIGSFAFQKGVQDYLHDHAFKNATYADFRSAMEKASKKDLKDYWTQWVLKKGVNSLASEFTCGNGRIDQFKLKQGTVSGDAVLRTHRTKVTLIKFNANAIRTIGVWEGLYQGETTELKELRGRECPDVAILNAGDMDYVKAVYDHGTAEKLMSMQGSFPDVLTRMAVWAVLAQSFNDGQLSIQNFAAHLGRELDRETDERLLSEIGRFVEDVQSKLETLHEVTGDVTFADLSQNLTDKIFQHLLMVSETGAQKVWLERYLDARETHVDRLKSLLDGKVEGKKFKLESKERWRILKKLAAIRHPATKTLASAESRRDKSYDAQLALLTIEASLAKSDEKKKILEKLSDMKLPKLERQAYAWGLFPREQKSERLEFFKDFMVWFRPLLEKHGDTLAASYLWPLSPLSSQCAERDIEFWQKAKNDFVGHTRTVHGIEEGLENIKTCRKIANAAGIQKPAG